MPSERFRSVVFVVFVCALSIGCASVARDNQLERVAKDWSLVIRASQVIPVYPPTEDLEPGDIFLVRMPISQQHREYKQRGFLPMDLHMKRLAKLDYATVYQNSYNTGTDRRTPHHWRFPPNGDPPKNLVALRAIMTPGPQNYRTHRDPTLWATAPRATFPTYSFMVDVRKGLGVALPIQGVPVALGIMQTGKAYGSVTLSDAYTYGVTYEQLVDKVQAWAAEPGNPELLESIRKGVHKGNGWSSKFENIGKFLALDNNPRTAYVRVVSRVYLVGAVNVSLLNASAGQVDAQAGANRDVSLLNPTLEKPTLNGAPENSGPPVPQVNSDAMAGNPAAVGTNPSSENAVSAITPNNTDADGGNGAPPVKADELVKPASAYQEALQMVTDNLGGAVKLQWATSRSVTMDETFARPLVIGYLGFDFPIIKDGRLGTPVATYRQLEDGSRVDLDSPMAGGMIGLAFANHAVSYGALKEDAEAQRLKASLDKAAATLIVIRFRRWMQPASEPESEQYPHGVFANSDDVVEYLSKLDRSIHAIGMRLADDPKNAALKIDLMTQKTLRKQMANTFMFLPEYQPYVTYVTKKLY